MKIADYSIGMNSEHTYARQVSRTETLRAWVGDQRPDFEAQANPGQTTTTSAQVAISEAARQAVAAAAEQQKTAPSEAEAEQAAAVESINDDTITDPKLGLLIKIVEALTGKKVKLMDAGEIGKIAGYNDELAEVESQKINLQANHGSGEAELQGWGVEYDFHEEIYESEKTSFSASGEIHTADGKRIQFDITLQMSREFYQQTSVSFRAGDAQRKDPLVINFEGNAAELTDQKFDFDIDADGQVDRISFLSSASGFLALDKNGNGTIDDGSELFGTRTGNGFAELAAYDSDGNGWIDENDAIFASLRIWTKDANGDDHLSTLAERNIGALYLGQTATPFDLKDKRNNQHGQILSTGLYLSENGRVGTMQQLDLFV
ncbi:hypothetical protein VRY85_12790 [Achromobacter sp. F4_2707]|uniref:hypothetical protein n=1 Tax=Achromobacter sp. F4_2707 TaxID=3114286 RepID=UPI0039C62939